MISFVPCLIACLVTAGPSPTDPLHELTEREVRNAFQRFKAYHEKSYRDADEEAKRFALFKHSLSLARKHNAQTDRTWTMGLNQFADMTDEEFQRLLLMEPQDCSLLLSKASGKVDPGAPDMALPDGMDWRERSVVSEVKNQGHCGSGWTFASASCLEAHLAIKLGDAWQTMRLSEQQLLDCAQSNHGCKGGLPSRAFEYVKSSGELSKESDYPYVAKDQACSHSSAGTRQNEKFEASESIVDIKVPGGAVSLQPGDEGSLKKILATRGPVTISFQFPSELRLYSEGVYSSKTCNSSLVGVNHVVLAVGYGTDADSGKPYWLLKNSWDYSWGEEGFFRMEAFTNLCGVASCMSYPDLYGEGNRPENLI